MFEKILDCAAFIIIWLTICVLALYCWTGAELIHEGAVYISKVEQYVICLVALFITRWLNRLEKKIVKWREVNNER